MYGKTLFLDINVHNFQNQMLIDYLKLQMFVHHVKHARKLYMFVNLSFICASQSFNIVASTLIE